MKHGDERESGGDASASGGLHGGERDAGPAIRAGASSLCQCPAGSGRIRVACRRLRPAPRGTPYPAYTRAQSWAREHSHSHDGGALRMGDSHRLKAWL